MQMLGLLKIGVFEDDGKMERVASLEDICKGLIMIMHFDDFQRVNYDFM